MSLSSNYEKVISLFKPDKDGISEWISIDRFSQVSLNWSNNGNQRHGVFFNVNEFVWEKLTNSRGSAVTHLRTTGLRETQALVQTISSRVRQHFVSNNICSLSLLSVPAELKEIDHRYGNKAHPDYVNLYLTENQKPEYFQVIFSVLNSAKRQKCVVCVASGNRPPHPTLGFVEGDENHPKNFPCSGCFLAEPEKYRGLLH